MSHRSDMTLDDFGKVSMPTQSSTAHIADASRAPALDTYAFHKLRFRDTAQHAELRKQSARWLMAMGISFDNDKLIDPEDLPL